MHNQLLMKAGSSTVLALIIMSCSAETPGQSQSKPSRSDYTIPEELQSVQIGRDGYSASMTYEFRRGYKSDSAITADDVGSYAASRLSEVGPTAIVHRAGPVSELESLPMTTIEQTTATTDLGTMTLRDAIDDPRSRVKAFAVLHKGKLVFEEYVGLREWDNHLWASATKILVGTLAHIVATEGLLDLDKLVTDHLPELLGTHWEGVKVEDVLHQRSGLDVSESMLGSSPDHPVTIFYAIAGGDDSLPADASLMNAVKAATPRREPGAEYEYASINTQVVVFILERVTNKPIEDLITERIWIPAGMEGDGVLGLSASGEPMVPGMFAARLRDLGRFGLLFTPSWGTVSREKVLSEDYFAKVYAAAGHADYGKDYMSKRILSQFAETDVGASYQWDAVFADGDVYKSGRTGQGLYVSPETDTVVVWYSSAYKAEIWIHAYAREIVKQLFRE